MKWQSPSPEQRAQLQRVSSWTWRLFLASLFAVAGLSKVGAASDFARDIANYRLVPDTFAAWAALFLPVLELVLAVGLLLPRYVRGAGALGALLLAGFAAAMAQAKLRGIDLACGCFGGDTQVSWGKVALNLRGRPERIAVSRLYAHRFRSM